MICVEEYAGSPEEWDAGLRSQPYGHFYQSSLSALLFEKYQGDRPLRWVARDGGRVVGLLQARVPRGSLVDRITRQITWSYGPVIMDPERATEIAVELLRAALRSARGRLLVRATSCTAPVHSGDALAAMERGYEAAGFVPTEWATYLTDGSKGEEQCWADLSSSARKAVRKAERNEVSVTSYGAGERTSEIVAIYNQCRARQRLPLLRPAYAAVFDEVFRRGGARFYLAEHRGRPLALLGCVTFGRIMLEVAAGQTELDVSESLCGNDLIRWRMIQAATREGLVYDQSGVSPCPASAKEEGIRRFKAKWGGTYVPYRVWRRTTLRA